ncbi:hypothetical protein Pcinc_022983 [Petrolisthes cinctipes]|uniref:Dipeptidase n=1 Tax=Petrolisthes cinctipes TaxID=88211 RepID=A0AAE1FEJ5_PETCI|nr:hypothetical protein Pcinc_022983 [Petrolisthes cinctipes]
MTSPENVPDDVLLTLIDNGGMAMVNFVIDFLIPDHENASITDVAAHITYIRDLVGADHVGIGSDFDGTDRIAQGLDDTSKYPYLLAELLLDQTWTDEDLRKLVGLNIVRVMKQVEQVRDNLMSEAPWDQPIPPEDLQRSPRLC